MNGREPKAVAQLDALLAQYIQLKESYIALEADLAALRSRYVEAVQQAFKEGFDAGNLASCKASAGYTYLDHAAAWLASSARRGLAEKGGEHDRA